MLGEKEPGIAYYPQSHGYSELLDIGKGGLGDAGKIAAAGFKVIRVYVGTVEEMQDLEHISWEIFKKYDLRTEAIFFPFLRSLINQQPLPLNLLVTEFIEHLGKYPWVMIQIGNEDNDYLKGGPSATRENISQ